MSISKLGRLERVPLRTVWPYEDRSFTPWLARSENLELCSATPSVWNWR